MISWIRNVAWMGVASGLCAGELSLEEKVGQLFMVHFQGKEMNAEALALVQEMHVGGIIYYNWANGLDSPEQVRHLSQDLQNAAKIPLFIAVDQEGGRVARLKNGFTEILSPSILGEMGDLEMVENFGYISGSEMFFVGVNMNLAPVVDIYCNPNHTVMKQRSYGSSAEMVSAFGGAAIDGYHRGGVLTCIKHFPGHGDVEVDSHEDLPILNKTKSELDAMEFVPFAKLAHKTDAIMTAHILVPSIDPKNAATVSSKIISILREEMDFDGVILSDSLVMKGILNNVQGSIDEVALACFEAGCDVLLLGGGRLLGTEEGLGITSKDILLRIQASFVQAVQNGRISEDRINASVQRILALKSKIRR